MSDVASSPEKDAPFYFDKVTGEPCPREGNVLCTLPYSPAHLHVHRPTPSPEKDVPEQVGYGAPWPVTEYGVFEDRRARGLGFSLLLRTEDLAYAERCLTSIQTETEYPRFLRQRVVVYQPWGHVLPSDVGAS